jgi:hypothetical protein
MQDILAFTVRFHYRSFLKRNQKGRRLTINFLLWQIAKGKLDLWYGIGGTYREVLSAIRTGMLYQMTNSRGTMSGLRSSL